VDIVSEQTINHSLLLQYILYFCKITRASSAKRQIPKNDYKERKVDRISRYEERAAAARGESFSRCKITRSIGDGIPMGQSILVGHHSEAKARADMKKINNATVNKAYRRGDGS
jgi:hypothetical protein